MVFDNIIGNPPYNADQNAQSVQPIYNKFILMSKQLQPEYLTMIVPAKWMIGGNVLLDSFREDMLNDKHITRLKDYFSPDVFEGADIAGGVCYFLWERDRVAPCKMVTDYFGVIYTDEGYMQEGDNDVFIRIPLLREIKRKVWKNKQESFTNILFSTPFPFESNYFEKTTDELFDEEVEDSVRCLGLINQKRVYKYIKRKTLGVEPHKGYKAFFPKAYGATKAESVFRTVQLGLPDDICTNSFLLAGYFNTQEEVEHLIKYTQTKFFNALVYARKNTQQANRGVYKYVPMQDFTSNSDLNWDEELNPQLYAKYGFTEEEINYIESNYKNTVND